MKLIPKIAQNFTDVGVNQILLPCMEFCLYDSDELIIFEAINCFKFLTKKNFLLKKTEENILQKIIPLILYPNNWIREEVFDFLFTILEKHSPIDVYCFIQPHLTKYFNEVSF